MMHFIRELNMQYANEDQDSESTCGYSILANMPDYNSFKFVDNSKVMKGLKQNKRVAVLEFHRRKEDEALRDVQGAQTFLARQDPVHGTDYPSSPVESEGSNGRKKIYIKKNMVDSFMPEMVGFFEDSNCHFFKDIFMDIEAHCRDDCLAENCDLDHNSIFSVLNSNVESGRNSTKETLDTLPYTTNGQKPSTEIDHKEDAVKQHSLVQTITEAEQKEESGSQDDVAIDHSSEKASLEKHVVPEETEEQDDDCTSEASYESEGESRSTIINTEASSQDEENLETQSVSSRPEDDISGNKENWDQNFFDQQGHYKSSSLSDDPHLSTIESLEPLPCCSSFSFRSSRSTSSSSSFAFPILLSEWTGTPARMPRADSRHLKRHRYWRKNLLCCRF